MITIPDVLLPEHVLLAPVATTAEGIVTEVAKLLQDDERVADWDAFYKAVSDQVSCHLAETSSFCICLPHARTRSVTSLVMSGARLSGEIKFAGAKTPVRYLFCVGVPVAMDAEYLRVVGALMRAFSDPGTEEALHQAPTSQAFIDLLAQREMKL